MKILYSPFYNGNNFLDMKNQHVAMDVQILETQGLLTQLAMHAGIHQQIPSYSERLTEYHKALLEYDASKPENIFHRSISIDSMSVAKTLLQWRDYLSLCGWNGSTNLKGSTRLKELAEVEGIYDDKGVAQLLKKLQDRITLMISGKTDIPAIYKELTIEVPCTIDLLPDYIQPILKDLQVLDVTIKENIINTTIHPETIKEIKFSQLWKAEAWLANQDSSNYDVWINANNKRLDNWLHMAGKEVGGCTMENSNPQITQMFLLAVQLFRRPLNVNTLLQYLYLPECPLNDELARKMAKRIVREGGFCNKKVLDCINDFIDNEFRKPDDKTPREMTREQREGNYLTYLPFDLRKEKDYLPLSEESDDVDFKRFKRFMERIYAHAAYSANKISSVSPNDARIPQLQTVSELVKALLEQIGKPKGDKLKYTTLVQWTQSLYEAGNYQLYQAQTGSRTVINNPANMIGEAKRAIWCDFYGDVQSARSTDFLSNYEQEKLKAAGVRIWDKEHEAELQHIMLSSPIHKTTKELTLITCKQQGATKLPMHPLMLQLPISQTTEDGDMLYANMASITVEHVDNLRPEDKVEVTFDAKKHKVTWRDQESFTALEKLLQTPFDYVMNYTLNFSDLSDTDIKMSLTNGNVAHEAIEDLFEAERDGVTLAEYVTENYEKALHQALMKKGALLLLPEHHLSLEILRHQLNRCVKKLAAIIEENGLTVEKCEQKGELEFVDKVKLTGYIDMRLHDHNGNDVVFDLKWTSKKDKHQKLIKNNRAMQLAIYQEMLKKHEDQAIPTGFFTMPAGILFSSHEFKGANCELVTPQADVNIMKQVKNGYKQRVKEINEGHIETADNTDVTKLQYNSAVDVFPLETEGVRVVKKVENKYSDYKCFTI